MNSLKAVDIAKYITEELGSMTAMKLQKLVYYSQAWSLVWDDCKLFDDPIEAWANGPVVRELYNLHKGSYIVSSDTFSDGDISKLSENQKDTVDTVLNAYKDKTPQWLSDQTHAERPWIEAREGLCETERGERIISLETMAEYYGSL
ncbi:putative phage-associated protein [Sedimentisphaera cyanobacteriorum]|uniref:Putative phage-associated protein n=1 Tax=Sedimentisphaera cyanobacteriorum TaxID=1940790 RepID=A0A1Q2HT39_9BACT|nr:type II toxin-antitoxin system antitoxin SocA domain-containing protein [Sedimentisphaera cyanobacteriorum]AQQ10493.1 putative phage-associated protein [Sedimentisphaera cyanobacteriorum]